METDAYPLPGEFPHHQATESCSLLLSAFDDTNLTFLPTQHPRPDMSRASPPSLARGEPFGRSQEMEPWLPQGGSSLLPAQAGFPTSLPLASADLGAASVPHTDPTSTPICPCMHLLFPWEQGAEEGARAAQEQQEFSFSPNRQATQLHSA